VRCVAAPDIAIGQNLISRFQVVVLFLEKLKLYVMINHRFLGDKITYRKFKKLEFVMVHFIIKHLDF
jgi:hypothetical protein